MIQFGKVRNYLNQEFEFYIREWFPNAYKVNNDIYKTGDFNDTKTKRGDGSLVINIKEKYAKDFATREIAGDIISIYAHRFFNGNQKQALDELVERYNLNFLEEEFLEQNINNDNDIIMKNTQQTNYSPLNVSPNCSELVELTPELSSKSELSSGERNSTELTPIRRKSVSNFQSEKDTKIKNILSRLEHYKEGDPVDLYLKSRGITKYSNDTYIVNNDKMAILVNVCKKTIANSNKEIEETGKLYRVSDTIAGIQEIFLTKDGKKRETSATVSKIQRSFSNLGISGNPVRLTEKGDNNGFIYVTEGIENGLSIQEYLNNEVWRALSIVNIPNLPFENDKVYIFVFDNDYHKEVRTKVSENLKSKLKTLDVSHNIYGDEIIYNGGEYNLKNTINKLRQLKNKHFFYLIPNEKGHDANDELKNGNLKKLLSETILKEIENESILKCNKRTKEVVYWRPQKQHGTLVNNNLTREFIGIPYDNRGIAIRFLKRFGENYRKVYGIGICKYDDGKYKQKQEDNLFADIQQTILMTYYEYDYLVDDELKKSFKKLWIDKGVGEYKTIINIEGYIKRCRELNINITEFDNENNNIINLSNGYYDLDKGKLMEHNRNKLFFRKLDTNYKSDIDLTNINNDWNKFLLSTFCDKINGNYSNDTKGLNNIRFLQKAMGYTFGSNNTNEEKVFMLLGQTRTGKSTCIDVIQEVMSSYSAGTQSEEFLTNDDTSNNYILGIKASLKGKRFLHISEISKSKRLNAAEIKRIAGDRFITAKYIYQQPFTFRNTVKYWISTNNIDFNNNEFDESVKSKLFIVDFNKRFYEAGTEEAIKTGRVIDKKLKERLLLPYNKEFILKWILEGYRLYREEGLTQTKEMIKALDEIEADNDSLGMFIKDNMREYDPMADELRETKKTLNDIYNCYTNYEINNYHTPEDRIISFKKFVKCVRAKGFHIERKWSINNNRKELFITDWCLNEEIKTRKEIKTEETKGGGGGTDDKQ